MDRLMDFITAVLKAKVDEGGCVFQSMYNDQPVMVSSA